MAPTIENHYATLGVRRTASAADIRAAYLAMARELHPDRHVASSPAEQARADRVMRKVNEAWDVLRDPKRKAAYDERLEQLSPRATPRTPPPRSSAPRSSQTSTPPPRPQGPRPDASATNRPGSTSTRSGSTSFHAGGRTTRPPGASARHGASSYGTGFAGEDDDDTDLAEVSPTTAWLARLIPIALLVGVLFFLLIVTAFAGGGNSGTGTDPGTDPGSGTVDADTATSIPGGPPVVLDLSDATCATVIDAGGVLYPQRADCAGPHDAIIAAEALSPDACPDGTDGLPFGGRALCLIFPDA